MINRDMSSVFRFWTKLADRNCYCHWIKKIITLYGGSTCLNNPTILHVVLVLLK